MIDIKYKNIYDEFIRNYEEIHPNPWHSISKEKLNIIYEELVNNMDINDKYSFNYFMNYIIKNISGKLDAHTLLFDYCPLPINFRIINDEVYVNSPKELMGAKLISINGVDINNIIKSIDNVIVYGTDGKRKHEIEFALFNKNVLLGLPELRNSDSIEYKLETLDNKIITKSFERNVEKTEESEKEFKYAVNMFNEFRYGTENATYYFEDNNLIYNLSSVQSTYKDIINDSLNKLKEEDLSNTSRIIINLTGNNGGNSNIVKYLLDFFKESGKELVAVIDYRLFSAGRHILNDLIKNGCIVVGTEKGTPMNCFGNNTWRVIDGKNFMISEWYFQYSNIDSIPCVITNKEEYNKYITDELLIPIYVHPDIYVEQTVEDFINGINTPLEYAKKMKLRNR